MRCFDCQKEITGTYEMTSDGYPICRRCLVDKYFRCKICGEITHKIFESNHNKVCMWCEDVKENDHD